MLHTGRKLVSWARDSDVGIKNFASSALATSTELIMPYYGMLVRRAEQPKNGFQFISEGCTGHELSGNNSEATLCNACASARKSSLKYISDKYDPIIQRAHPYCPIAHIARDEAKSRIEIVSFFVLSNTFL